MKFIFFYTYLLVSFSSCKTYKMLEGKSRPVFFYPDSSVFNDPDFTRHTISYNDLFNLRGNFVNSIYLDKEKTSEAVIQRATFFRIAGNQFLIYPGEKIKVAKGLRNDFTFYSNKNNKRRNRELIFFKKLSEVKNTPDIPFIQNASLDTILYLEKRLKVQAPELEKITQYQFDSLQNVLMVSKKFKKLTRNYLQNRYDLRLLYFYRMYADTLIAHNLYLTKMKGVLPFFNNITEIMQLDNKVISLNEFVVEVIPFNIKKISNEYEFRFAFDTVSNYFNGLAQDYLLSEIMYYAITNNMVIPTEFAGKYEILCKSKTYKSLIAQLKEQQLRNDNLVKLNNNSLLFPDGKRVITLEELITDNKGKIIVLDFWAHWCAPCKEDMPALKKLAEDYQNKNIVFIKISIDAEIQPWRKAVIEDHFALAGNYLLVDIKSSSFASDNNIDAIPRYIILDVDGKIVNANAPRPGNIEMQDIINNLLTE